MTSTSTRQLQSAARPSPRRGAALPALLVAAALFASLPLAAQPAPDALLASVLAAVAGQPLKATRFVERRSSALFDSPLESRGTLTYQPEGRLEKHTTTPIHERLTIDAEAISIQAEDGSTRLIRLDAEPALAAHVRGLRAILGGDVRSLRQYFDARFTGTAGRWELTLRPRESAMGRAIRQVIVRGERGLVQVIETTEIGGDVNELTLLQRPGAKSSSPPAR